MQFFAELTNLLVAIAPETQEFYLFCFFCLGFVLFRSQAVKRLVQCMQPKVQAKGTPLAEKVPRRRSLSRLSMDFAKQDFTEVLAAWPVLEEQTAEALSMTVTALLALGRPEEIGLFIAKAVATMPYLRDALHLTVSALAEPTIEVPRQRIVVALRDLYDQARNELNPQAIQVLAVSFSRVNDEQRVNALMQLLSSKGQSATRDTLIKTVQGFLGCKNLDAAFGVLHRLVSAEFVGNLQLASLQRLVTDAARVASEADVPEGEHSDPAATRDWSWEMLELLENMEEAPVEAFTLLLEWAARQNPGDTEMASRVEQQLRTMTSCNGGALPTKACVALVQVHASVSGNQAKAHACFKDILESAEEEPTDSALVGMITSCIEAKNSDLAEHIYSWANGKGRCTPQLLGAAVKVLGAAKQSDRICQLYRNIQDKEFELDEVLYGTLIKHAVQAGQLGLARQLFGRSKNPDAQNYMSLMRACGQEGNPSQALDMLWDLRARGQADAATYNSALDVCVSCGDMQSASTVFQHMKESGHVDVVSYNILLKQHIGGAGSAAQVDALFQEMRSLGLQPNIATYNSLLGGYLSSEDYRQAWRTVDIMEREGPGIDAYTISILFKGYKGKRHVMDAASFDRALALIQKYTVKVDEVLVNVALEACVSLRDPGRLTNALNVFRRSGWTMPKQCAMHTYATLIKAYGQSRQLGMARRLWNDITCKKGLVPSEQLYGQMIDVLVTNDCLDDALELFAEMKQRHQDHLTSQGFAVAYAMVIKGFAQRKECARALQCYEEMKQNGTLVGLVVFNTLIDACSRVGDMDSAARLFRDMVEADCIPDLITYSTLIKGYCVRGELDQAMELFACMRRKGIQPDAIVFNSLLDGCAKKQMPVLCEQVIQDMVDAGVTPSNYSASILIKLYGRCRDLDAAFRVINEMPQKYGFRPNAAVYTCLMTTCITNGRMDLALDLRRRMLQEGTKLDEKTYSTLIRGALRGNNVEQCVSLIHAALDQGGSRFVDEELVQGTLVLIQRRRLWDERGQELMDRLRDEGVRVYFPTAQQPQQYQNYQQQHDTGAYCPERGFSGGRQSDARSQQRRRFPQPPKAVVH